MGGESHRESVFFLRVIYNFTEAIKKLVSKPCFKSLSHPISPPPPPSLFL